MLSLRDFFQSSAQFRDHVNPTNNFRVGQVVPILGGGRGDSLGNELALQAVFLPLTDKGVPVYTTDSYGKKHLIGYNYPPKEYLVTIVFHGLSYVYKKDTEHQFGVEIFAGQPVWMSRPSFSRTAVTCNCQCKDFYFACAYWNSKEFALAGPDKVPDVRYGWDGKRKDGKPLGSIPSPNPDPGTPLLCKHLLRFSRYLADKGLLLP